ncbi:hypothetical protein [Foetidibacter luteolus]|uniref:hypothetical protein n=1 Tax=Foetidibacter luteolus TaxID=2608880 RepID=UPI00129B768E|nr:hypothetical protein [Foetidibacter luteolus]
MTDQFILTVKYKGIQLDLESKLLVKGYSYQFCIQLDETEVYFERDEDQHYRALAMPGQNEKLLHRVDPELLKEIALKLEATFS